MLIAAGPAHADTIAALHEAAMPGEGWSAGAWRSLLALPGGRARIAASDGAPGGFLHLRAVGEEAEIVMLAVRPESRRRGLAAALLRDALARPGGGALFLEVAEDNEAARALYERFGFRQVGRRPGYYRTAAGRRDALVLRRDGA